MGATLVGAGGAFRGGALSRQLTWDSGLGAITHIQGPADENLAISSGAARTIALQGGLFHFGLGGMLSFGGTSAAVPGIKRNAGRIEARLADDTGYADLAAKRFGAGISPAYLLHCAGSDSQLALFDGSHATAARAAVNHAANAGVQLHIGGAAKWTLAAYKPGAVADLLLYDEANARTAFSISGLNGATQIGGVSNPTSILDVVGASTDRINVIAGANAGYKYSIGTGGSFLTKWSTAVYVPSGTLYSYAIRDEQSGTDVVLIHGDTRHVKLADGSLLAFGAFDVSRPALKAVGSQLRAVTGSNTAYVSFDCGDYYHQNVKVVGGQGAAVADAAGGATIDAEARTAINTLLARLRTHGLIAT